jgi:hypothetical protein
MEVELEGFFAQLIPVGIYTLQIYISCKIILVETLIQEYNLMVMEI